MKGGGERRGVSENIVYATVVVRAGVLFYRCGVYVEQCVYIKAAFLYHPPQHTPQQMGSIDDNTSGGTYAYRVSKAGLNIVNKSLSLDLEPHNITAALLHPGWVRTDMVNNHGLIDTDECVAGLLKVLERGHEINGRWFDFANREIKW